MSTCYLCTDEVESIRSIRLDGTKMVCEICWSEASCHKVGDLEGRIELISELEGGPEPLWYICRGHVNIHEFKHEMMAAYGIEISFDDVEHTHLRAVPYGDSMCVYRSEPGRGAFKATLFDPYQAEVP